METVAKTPVPTRKTQNPKGALMFKLIDQHFTDVLPCLRFSSEFEAWAQCQAVFGTTHNFFVIEVGK